MQLSDAQVPVQHNKNDMGELNEQTFFMLLHYLLLLHFIPYEQVGY